MGPDAASIPPTAHGVSTDGAPGQPPPGEGPRLASVVVFVRDLDVSVAFYEELLRMTLTARSTTAALLVGAGQVQLYLRAVGLSGEQPLGAVGVQYVIWSAASLTDLHRCDRVLRERSAHTSLSRGADGLAVLEGRDPDGLPLLLAYPGPQYAAREHIMPRIYSW